MKNILWKVYFLLLILAVAGAAGILPYSMTLSGNTDMGLPPGVVLLAAFLQSFFAAAILGFFGMKLSLNTGLGLPVLENLLYGSGGVTLQPRSHILFPAAAGVVCGIVMIAADLAMIHFFNIDAGGGAAFVPAWWKGILAAFYGGISEEIMLRLFVMNLIIYIMNAADKSADRKSSIVKVVSAMIISSVLFGAGHLAAAFASGLASPAFIARTMILNFIPGMVFGWIYWRKSFLSAMTAHFVTDIVIHAAARFLIDTFSLGA